MMLIRNSLGVKNLLKATIGWCGLLYFFITNNETWGEAIGLTLFFASGQLQTAIKPPITKDGWLSSCVSTDDLLEAWRITLGLTSFIYYFYFALYLNTGLNIYVSTICLSLLWESQIVDDVINMISSWLSCEMVPSVKLCAKNVIRMKIRFQKSKSGPRNIIQDFLCVLCKLYKHLRTNFQMIYYFLINKITSEIETSRLGKVKFIAVGEKTKPLPADVRKKTKENISQYLSCITKEMTRKNMKHPIRLPLNIIYNWRINNSCNVKYLPLNAQPQYCKKNAFHNTKNLSKARAVKSAVF